MRRRRAASGTITGGIFLALWLLWPFRTESQPDPAFLQKEKDFGTALLKAFHGTTPNQRSFDVRYYGLDLQLDIPYQMIYGRVRMLAEIRRGPLSAVELHADTGLQVDSAFVDGQWLVPWRKQDSISVVVIDFPKGPRNTGDTVWVTVAYHGRPRSTGFGPFKFSSAYNRPMVWSLSEPFGAHFWWPCKDDPADKADSADIRITVPPGLIAVSNGKLRKVTARQNRVTYWWHEKYPIATYLISIAVHDYAVFSDSVEVVSGIQTPIDFYVFPEDLERAQISYSVTKPMLVTFSQLFGPYPFFDEKYGHAQFVGPANMEHQTISSMRSFAEGIIAHELAHQWWGDMITCASFEHIWLNEGFASYAEALWQEARYGKKAYQDRMRRFAYLGDGTVYVPPREIEQGGVARIFDYDLSYRKGAFVLHMLRYVLGDSLFFRALQAYGQQPELKYNVATTEDFQRVCEDVSGQDLDAFFQQWVYGEGYPQYAYRMTTVPVENGVQVNVTVEQKQPWPVFQMPLEFLFRFPVGDTLVRVWNHQRVQQYVFQFSSQPTSLELDPNHWILKKAWQTDVAKANERSSPALPQVHQYPNPFVEGCWFRIGLPQQSQLSVQIFDLLGRMIHTLVDAELRPGTYPLYWDGRDRSGVRVPPGIYFVRIRVGYTVRSVKIVRIEP